MKKVLFIATVDEHIRHFHFPHLKSFKDRGYEVHVASNGTEVMPSVDKKFNIAFERRPFKLNNFKAYLKLKKILKTNKYNIIHCHTPVASAVGRLAASSERHKGTKVIYTAHGFHFYHGASWQNWVLYYTAEKFLSGLTDVLVTINEEDYQLALENNFKAKQIELVRGVGIDLEKYPPQTQERKKELRKEYGFRDEDFILIYVAELSYRKNQEFLIKGLSILSKEIKNIKLLLVGQGELYPEYSELVKSLNIANHIELLGYRTDVPDLMASADVTVSSARQEGLPVNVMEAMATGLPLVVSDIRGNRDLISDGKNGFLFKLDNVQTFVNAIKDLYYSQEKRRKFGEQNIIDIEKYDIKNTMADMERIYENGSQ